MHLIFNLFIPATQAESSSFLRCLFVDVCCFLLDYDYPVLANDKVFDFFCLCIYVKAIYMYIVR